MSNITHCMVASQSTPSIFYSIKVVINAAKFLDCDISAVTLLFKLIKSYQNVVELLKSTTKWNARNRPGMSADGWRWA